jgi:dipeptidyl aminopeptidase/acylaminoacyl peptidase
VRFEKNQVALRDQTTSDTTLLTTDGTAAQPYRGSVAWSPDGQSFVVLAVKDAPVRKVTVIESSPADQTQPKTHTFDYAKPGDELPRPRPVLFRLADRQPVRIADELFPNPFTPGGTLDIRWSPRSDEFFFDYNQRGHQLWRILAVNAQTGAVRTVIEEKARTFIDYTNKTWRHWLDDTRELLWMSERDSWCHLWLYDTATGAVKNQVTRGEWVVRKVERVDAKKRQVWFLASGLRAGEDPYHRHLCRVNFDGSGFVQLTAGDGDHAIALSPDARFFTDTWSRADHPPVFELRHSDDGKLICELERADASALLATGWTMPERLVAKGRDGVTEIHGVLIKPSHFDPAKKYPVLEEVYAGPHGAFSPKKFFTLPRQHALAELGFIVVQADGMGTNHRGKAFHDLAWKNLQDAGFPDRIAWIKAAAVTRPWMDLTRVGIYGGSAGGQNAMRALLDHADFYRAAFADCGCHDNRMDKIWWNEQWLGWPVDESYVRASNVVDAAKLRGALMLCMGELDRNVDPASTMQVVHALQKAGKPFDLLVVAGAGHGAAETPYANRRRMEFFARHLPGAD